MARLLSLPLIVLLVGIGAIAMLVPALHAYTTRDLETARAFLYSSTLFLILFAMLAVTTSNYRITRQGRSHLISMMAFFAVLPLMLAVPFAEAVPDTRLFNAYIEMVSAVTTTGLTLFDASRLPDSVHLWRAEVAWLGGFFVWVSAAAILAPLNLGGFEVASAAEVGQGATTSSVVLDRAVDPSERLVRFALRFAPIYGGLTLVLWITLILAGDDPLVAICHAMSTLSTSAISPIGGVGAAGSGFAGEALIFLFFVFALSRITFMSEDRRGGWSAITRDPELRLGVAIVGTVPVILFLRHWVASIESDGVGFLEGIQGIWGAMFTVASFLTTTGFVSEAWGEARAWSGLESPGLVLMGLAVFGGGVATTAGGVKLLRVFALLKHGEREMGRLVQPSSVGGAGQAARRFRRQGAYVAWIFFMLFAMSIALVTTVLALAGMTFEDALIIAVATLSTTGPLVAVADATPLEPGVFSDVVKGIVAGAMILGRLETLALIALLNPEFWR